MLADDDAASEIALGEGGLIAHLPKGATHISMSTISVALSKRLARAHAQAGQRYVAAPVFGRPDMAAAGKLFIVAAGDPRRSRSVSRCSVHGAEDNTDRDGAGSGESGQTQRQLSDGGGHRGAGRGRRTDRQGRHRPAGVHGVAHLYAVRCAGRTRRMDRSSLKASSSRPRLRHRSDTRTSGWRWSRPRTCACRCRSGACCMIGFCASWPRVASHLDWAAHRRAGGSGCRRGCKVRSRKPPGLAHMLAIVRIASAGPTRSSCRPC